MNEFFSLICTIASAIASRLASRIPRWSITSCDEIPTQVTHFPSFSREMIFSKRISRFSLVSFLESVSHCRSVKSKSKETRKAPATTGPAHAPRQASSTQMMISKDIDLCYAKVAFFQILSIIRLLTPRDRYTRLERSRWGKSGHPSERRRANSPGPAPYTKCRVRKVPQRQYYPAREKGEKPSGVPLLTREMFLHEQK